MDLKSIAAQQAQFVRNSVRELTVDRALGTVSIQWAEVNGAGDDDVFLQGHQAEEFIEGADALYEEETMGLTRDDAYHVMAYSFAAA